MDILAQYYNQAGQIVSRAQDLAKREFYRDVMCRHKFNEMFVAGKETDGVGYSYSNNLIFLNCGNMPGGLPCVGIGDASKDYTITNGTNGDRAIKPTAISMLPYWGGYKNFTMATSKNETINFWLKNLRLRSIFKLGPSISYINFQIYDADSGSGLDNRRETYFQIGINAWMSQRQLQVYAPTSLYEGYSSESSSDWYIQNNYTDGFLFDNSFHVYDAFLNIDGSVSLRVDGNTVLAGEFPSPWIEGFYSPILEISCGFNNGYEEYTIESFQVEAV